MTFWRKLKKLVLLIAMLAMDVAAIVQNTVNPDTVKTAFSMTSQLRQH